MLTHEGCLARRQRLWDSVAQFYPDAEWLLVADQRHVQYLANFMVQPLSFSGGERGLLLLERGGKATLMGDNFAIRAAAHQPFIDQEIVEKWYDHKHGVINRDHALFNALAQVSGELKGVDGLVEMEALPVGAGALLTADIIKKSLGKKGEESPTLGTLIRQCRRQKEADEIELIRLCCKGGNAGQKRLRKILKAGISEFKIFREVQRVSLKAVGRPGLIYGDFRANNAKNPKTGGLPIDYRLQKGDLYILDYSVVLDGYRCDFTNTMSVGHPSKEVLRNFETCQQAMANGEATLKAGVKAADVYWAVKNTFVEAGCPDAFTHHAGHGIGLAHPEPPILVPESEDVLIAGDVITLEPGAYVEGVGGMRIEHNYLITDEGFERLSGHEISLT